MKKIIFGVLLIILIAVGIFVFSIVRSFNVEAYKKQVISSLEQLTGRRVTCADEASLSWRPKPTFIMNDLVISNQDGSKTPNMVSIKQIQVEMDWASFLRPSLVVKRVVLKNPNVLVERLHSYQTNFTFPYLFNPEQTLEENGIIKSSSELIINSFEVVDGSLTYYNDLTSDMLVLNQINGQGKIDSLNGPFSFKGQVKMASHGANVDLTVNKLAAFQPVTGNLVLKDSTNNGQAEMNYTLSFDKNSDWLVFEGSCSSQNPTEFFAQLGDLKWPELGELKGNFKWIVNPKKSTLKELFFVQGSGEGAISFNWEVLADENTKKDKLVFEMDHLDYTLWQPVVEKIFPLVSGGKDSVLVDKVSIKQLLYNDQTVTDILVQGNIENGVFDGNLSAKLPFDTSLTMTGKWQIIQHELQSEINVQTPNLFPLIQWATSDEKGWVPNVENVPSQWTAKLNITDLHQNIDISLATIDKTQISGTIGKDKDTFKTDLKIQNLDFDTYYPSLKTTEKQVLHDWVLNAGRNLMGQRKNGQLYLDMSDITLLQTSLNQLIFKGKWSEENWDIEQFKLQKEDDLDLQYSGQIRQFGKPEFKLNRARLDFDIPNWQAWQGYFQLPELISKLNQFSSVSGVINYSGNFNEGDIEMESTLDKLKLTMSGLILPSRQSFNKVQTTISHPDFSQLMKMIQPEKVWSSTWAMPVEFNGTLSKDGEKITWGNSKVTLGKNDFKSFGQWQTDLLDVHIQATQLDLGAFLPPISNLNQEIKLPSDWINTRLDVAADRFTYGDIKGLQFKLKASFENEKWEISGLDCLVGEEQPGRFSLDGTVNLDKAIQPDIHLEWDKIQVGRNDLAFGQYRFSDGALSGNAQIKTKGNSWMAFFANATGKGQMSWSNGTLYGMDASAWLTAVQSALANEQIGQAFSSSLQYALSNGKTPLPDLEGTFVANKGFLNFTDVHGSNDLITLSGGVVDWALGNESTHIKMPIILTAISKLPAVVFDFNYNAYSIQSIPFEQAFDEELRLKNRQSAEARQLQNLKEIEVKNKQMRSEAQNIMANMEQTLTQLQERVALQSDEQANKKMDELNYTAREIRDLAVKVDMSPTEYAALLEKARLWAVQVTDLNNFYARQELLNQKVKTNQLSPLVNTYLANIEQIYQQHPQSVILAEIVMNSRQVAALIKEDETKLASAKDAKTVQSMIIRIQDNFEKIEKAHQYAQKLHLSLMNGGVSL